MKKEGLNFSLLESIGDIIKENLPDDIHIEKMSVVLNMVNISFSMSVTPGKDCINEIIKRAGKITNIIHDIKQQTGLRLLEEMPCINYELTKEKEGKATVYFSLLTKSDLKVGAGLSVAASFPFKDLFDIGK